MVFAHFPRKTNEICWVLYVFMRTLKLRIDSMLLHTHTYTHVRCLFMCMAEIGRQLSIRQIVSDCLGNIFAYSNCVRAAYHSSSFQKPGHFQRNGVDFLFCIFSGKLSNIA